MIEKEYVGIIKVNNKVRYIYKDNIFIYSGGMIHAGFIEHDKYIIDPDFSFDVNFQDFIDCIKSEINDNDF